MEVELQYFDDCPNWRVTDDHLRTLAGEFTDVTVTRHLVNTSEEAARVRFRGSPTILLDGVDPFAAESDPVGDLSCRVYQTPDGPVGSPTLDQLRREFLNCGDPITTPIALAADEPARTSDAKRLPPTT